jgi:N-acetylglucosamine-6-phosphate deacetylase
MAGVTLLVEGGRVPISGALQPAHVEIAERTIAAVTVGHALPRVHGDATLDATGCTVLPGFIDVHVHGALDADTMDAATMDAATMDGDVGALARMARFASHHGVTAFLPTTMTADAAATLAAVQGVAAAGARPHANGAVILGVHLEGPFISPRFPGAQPASAIRPPDLIEFDRLCAAGPVRTITLAPELPGSLDIIRKAQERGIVAVAGHTAATYAECETAIAAGIRQATHTYNAMTGLHHREPGTLGSVLSNDHVYAQLIADNIHVHPAAMKILARCKGIERTILITDAMRAAGMPPGRYDLGGQAVTVTEGVGGRAGECRLPDGTLAGSVLTMERALANFNAATGLDVAQTWPTTSRTAAASLGVAHERGELKAGYVADVTLLDDAGDVVATVVQGRIVYLRDRERLRAHRGDHDPDGPGDL